MNDDNSWQSKKVDEHLNGKTRQIKIFFAINSADFVVRHCGFSKDFPQTPCIIKITVFAAAASYDISFLIALLKLMSR